MTTIEPTFVAHLPTRRVKKITGVTWPPFQGPSKQYQPYRSVPTGKTKYLDINEWKRRDGIIKGLAGRCPLHVGDRVRPMNDKEFEEKGWFRVTGICRTWDEFCGSTKDETQVEWPANDQPMIVHASPEQDGQESCVATFMYFRRAYPNEQTC